MATVRPGQGFVPGGSLDALRLYLLKRSTGIDTAKPGVETVATTDAGAVTVATFGWTWAGSHREAPAPDGFVVWEEWTTSAAPSTPLLRSHYAPITARGHQTVVLPGFCVRVAVQTFRVQHERIEFGGLVQSDEWVLDRTGDPLLSGGAASVAWGAITGTLSAQTDLQAALNAKLDDSQASAFGLTLLDDADAATARTTLGLGTAATQAATAFATAAQGALADSAWQPGDELTTPDEVYDATAWNGSLEVPTKNAIRDKIESMGGATWGAITGTLSSQADLQTALDGKLDDSQLSDTAYNATSWNGVTTVAPSKNAVRDKIESLVTDIAAKADPFEWQELTTVGPHTISPQNGYIANYTSGVLEFNLTPSGAAAVGDTIKIVGKASTKWKITQNAGQQIHFPWASTTAGATGEINAKEQFSAIELVCVTGGSSSIWVVASSSGNFTVA